MAVYLLLGDDEDRKKRSVEKLRRDRTPDSYEAAESSPEEVVSACNSYSLFGDGAFVLVRNLDAWNAAQKAKIVSYLQNPSPETDLVMLGSKLGAREKLLSAVKESGEVHNFEQPSGKALVKWVMGYAKKQGLDLPQDVAGFLSERCSEDKTRLAREVEKLSLYVEDRSAANEDVEALCPPDLQSNIFAFVDALASGERGRALKLLEDLLSTGEPPLRVMYMIRRQFNLLARASSLSERGTSAPELAKDLKVPPFVVRKLQEQGRRMKDGDVERALETILDLESGLKGGRDLGDELQVELAVLKLAR
ncbi:MAG: DNA polymerase III subunit delta [Rubrobacteraceae bacterium]